MNRFRPVRKVRQTAQPCLHGGAWPALCRHAGDACLPGCGGFPAHLRFRQASGACAGRGMATPGRDPRGQGAPPRLERLLPRVWAPSGAVLSSAVLFDVGSAGIWEAGPGCASLPARGPVRRLQRGTWKEGRIGRGKDLGRSRKGCQGILLQLEIFSAEQMPLACAVEERLASALVSSCRAGFRLIQAPCCPDRGD